MLPKINPANTAAWRSLQEHFSEMKNVPMKELFKNDPDRFSKYSISNRDIVFDHSKNIINDKTIQLLLQLANESRVKDGIDAMFNGEKINETEKWMMQMIENLNRKTRKIIGKLINIIKEKYLNRTKRKNKIGLCI